MDNNGNRPRGLVDLGGGSQLKALDRAVAKEGGIVGGHVIGAPDIITWYPTVLLKCSCRQSEAAVLIGFKSVWKCPTCGQTFTVDSLMYDGENTNLALRRGAPKIEG